MRAVPIPDGRVWERDGVPARRVVFGAPVGMEDRVLPAEALVDNEPSIGPRIALLIQLEPGDLEQLQQDPHLWLMIYGGQLPPFALVLP